MHVMMSINVILQRIAISYGYHYNIYVFCAKRCQWQQNVDAVALFFIIYLADAITGGRYIDPPLVGYFTSGGFV